MNNLKENDLTTSPAIKEEDTESQYILGIKHLFGDGVEENTKQGLKLLKQAATQRHLEAQFLLGQLFQMGFKTLQSDITQAIKWYTLAARQKHPEAGQILQQLGAPLKVEIAKPPVEIKRKVSQKPVYRAKAFPVKKVGNERKFGQEKKPFNTPKVSNLNKTVNPQKIVNDELIKACQKGEDEKVKKALSQGADVNIIDQEGLTPLQYAARFGRALIVRTLLDNKANIHVQNGEGKTAADLALKNGHRDIAQLIKRYEAK